MNIGDIVCRKKYNKDIFFEIIDIQEKKYTLRGIEYRLIADSEEDDLELVDFKKTFDKVDLSQEKSLKGTVLHIDGDKDYLKMCMNKYKEYGIMAYGYTFQEEDIKNHVIPLLEKHKPNLIVITGHDALKKNGHKKNGQDYLHSLDFVEAIKKAREYESDKDTLIIFAGACQSYYELLLASGANFASSPSRKNIHALDPVIISSQVVSTNIKQYVDLKDIIEKTSFKQLGIGGVDTRGVARNLYPR
ncbi:MAG: sporulation peptidase YabG [Faecalibacillus sp.]